MSRPVEDPALSLYSITNFIKNLMDVAFKRLWRFKTWTSYGWTSVANGFVSSKTYDKRDDFDFDIVNFPFLDGDVPRRASYGVYISQLK